MTTIHDSANAPIHDFAKIEVMGFYTDRFLNDLNNSCICDGYLIDKEFAWGPDMFAGECMDAFDALKYQGDDFTAMYFSAYNESESEQTTLATIDADVIELFRGTGGRKNAKILSRYIWDVINKGLAA